MHTRPLIAAVISMLLLTAQQDLPLRAPGRFTATASGALSGPVAGDATVTRFRNGVREIDLVLDSDQMMSSNRMIAISIRVQATTTASPIQLNHGNTILRLDNLNTHESGAIPVQGSLQLKGRDTLQGSFKLSGKSGANNLSLSGSFVDAPVLPGLD
ncbi:MAG: hypothetical protein ABL973_19330 [Micropepsaceae bacterium]